LKKNQRQTNDAPNLAQFVMSATRTCSNCR
jgi:hypothetical protein